jgi:hypothetical protein
MRSLFPEYYRPTEQEFSKMWQECIFAFDANMLLNVYRYTPQTQTTFFEVLEGLKDRIWVPYQAAKEFHENRLNVIGEQHKLYDDIEKTLNAELARLKGYRHLFIDLSQIIQVWEENTARVKAILEEAKSRHTDFLASDDLLEKVTLLFDGKVGPPYPPEKLQAHLKEAESRIKQNVPPGYLDKGKSDARPYGDVVLWFQLIDQAKNTQRPIIFVSDDAKDDWWTRFQGKTIGPKSELIAEMRQQAGVGFHMYQTDQFLRYAEDFLKLAHQPEVIEEVREVREEAEARNVDLRDIPVVKPYFATAEDIKRTIELERLQKNELERAKAVGSVDPFIHGYELASIWNTTGYFVKRSEPQWNRTRCFVKCSEPQTS